MFALRAACSGVRGAASASSGSVLLRSATAVLLPLPSALPAAASSSLMRSTGAIASASVRHSSSATAFHMKKQKEWRTRAARGFAPMKTHAGCKKRFRFISRFAVVCKHSGKYHKNYRQSTRAQEDTRGRMQTQEAGAASDGRTPAPVRLLRCNFCNPMFGARVLDVCVELCIDAA